jgi:hypothetical protein
MVDPDSALFAPAQSWRTCLNAIRYDKNREVSGATLHKTPTRRTHSPCCARAAIGHAAAPPEQRDELAPLQLIEWHPLPFSQGGSIADWQASGQGLAAVRDVSVAEVAFGSKAALWPCRL